MRLFSHDKEVSSMIGCDLDQRAHLHETHQWLDCKLQLKSQNGEQLENMFGFLLILITHRQLVNHVSGVCRC